jgi:hypothetical protein
MDASADRDLAATGFRRTLKLHHLILSGIIIIEPAALMSIYGLVSTAARGRVVPTILMLRRFFGVVSPKTGIPRNNLAHLNYPLAQSRAAASNTSAVRRTESNSTYSSGLCAPAPQGPKRRVGMPKSRCISPASHGYGAAVITGFR